jgi:hypothetical protein
VFAGVHKGFEVGGDMPQHGDKNLHFGVYRSVCCGSEIIIREGATFPDCPAHPNLSTVWKEIDSEKHQDVIVIRKPVDPAA